MDITPLGGFVKTRKIIKVELGFDGTGKVVERPKGTFRGSALLPKTADRVQFTLLREEDPSDGGASLNGAFQLNMWGSSEAYRALGTYLLTLAELDTTADPDYHEHVETISFDGRTRLEIILRKPREVQPPNRRLEPTRRMIKE